jgi:hypothetical protein
MDGTGPEAVPHAALLLRFADAALSFDATRIALLRAEIQAALGEEAMLDAAAVIAGFNGIARIADATGIPMEDQKRADTDEWRGRLGIDDFRQTKY